MQSLGAAPGIPQPRCLLPGRQPQSRSHSQARGRDGLPPAPGPSWEHRGVARQFLFESDGWPSTHVRQGAGWRHSDHVGLTYFWKEMADQIPQGCQAPGSPRPLLGEVLGRAKGWGPSGTCPHPPHCCDQLPGGGTHAAKPNKETLEHG